MTILSIYLVMFFMSFGCYAQVMENANPETVVYSKLETLVGFDYTFDNEALNRPYSIKYLPENKEIVVLDVGNCCMYFFNTSGKYLRKSGQRGRGPGDLMEPRFMDLNNDVLYVYEVYNFRFSLFSSKGKYIDTFKIPKILGNSPIFSTYGFSVSSEGTIIANMPASGYYITEFNSDGEVIGKIGKLEKYEKNSHARFFGEGFTFKTPNNKYYVFLSQAGRVKVYNKDLTKEKDLLIDFPEIEIIRKKRDEAQKEMPNNLLNRNYFSLIQYRDGLFYILVQNISDTPLKDKRLFAEPIIYVLNENLTVIKTLKLPRIIANDNAQESFNVFAGEIFLLSLRFDFMGDTNTIVMPNFDQATIMVIRK